MPDGPCIGLFGLVRRRQPSESNAARLAPVELDLDVVSYAEAAAEHDCAAERHDKAAGYWARLGDADGPSLNDRQRVSNATPHRSTACARVSPADDRSKPLNAPVSVCEVHEAQGPWRTEPVLRERGGASIR